MGDLSQLSQANFTAQAAAEEAELRKRGAGREPRGGKTIASLIVLRLHGIDTALGCRAVCTEWRQRRAILHDFFSPNFLSSIINDVIYFQWYIIFSTIYNGKLLLF